VNQPRLQREIPQISGAMVNSCLSHHAIGDVTPGIAAGRFHPAPKRRTREIDNERLRVGSPDAAQRNPGICPRSLDAMSQYKT